MGFTRTKQQDNNTAYYTEFVFDEELDLDSLPTEETECSIGSVALCIATGDVYMLNSLREWIKI